MLQQILALWPLIAFDLQDALLASNASSFLRERWGHFLASLSDTPTNLLTEAEICRFVGDSSIPFWASFEASTAFEELPILNKDKVAARLEAMLRPTSDVLWVKQTSGTTGVPTRYFYSVKFVLEQRFLAVPKALYAFALEKRLDLLDDASVNVHITDTETSKTKIMISPLNPKHLYLNLRFDDPDIREVLLYIKPDVVSSRPELLEILSEEILSNQGHLKAVISAGSALSLERRALVEARMKVPVIDVYSSSEFPSSGFQCANGKMHFDETSVLAELVGPDGSRLSEGQTGDLVLSSIANEVLPLIRFNTGDRARFDPVPCDCGRKSFTLESPRLVPVFRDKDGRPVAPTPLNALSTRFRIGHFQIAQTEPGTLALRIAANCSAATTERSLEALRTFAEQRMGLQVRLELIQFEDLLGRPRYSSF